MNFLGHNYGAAVKSLHECFRKICFFVNILNQIVKP